MFLIVFKFTVYYFSEKLECCFSELRIRMNEIEVNDSCIDELPKEAQLKEMLRQLSWLYTNLHWFEKFSSYSGGVMKDLKCCHILIRSKVGFVVRRQCTHCYVVIVNEYY